MLSLHFGLKRIDDGRQMMGLGAGAELLQGFWFHFCVTDIDDDVEAFPKMFGTLHNHIRGLDALGGHMTLGGHLGLAAIEVNGPVLEVWRSIEFPSISGRDVANEPQLRQEM